MGSWHAICGISNIPIMYGDRAVFLLLKPNPTHRHNRGLYSTEWYSPFALPIRGTYNDYGHIECADEAPHVEALRAYLKREACPMEVGENSYHDLPVNAAMFDKDDWLAQVQQRIDQGRLVLGKGTRLCSILIREDVWDEMAAWALTTWRGEVVTVDTQVAYLRSYRNPLPEDAYTEQDLIELRDFPERKPRIEAYIKRDQRRKLYEKGEAGGWGYLSPLWEIFEARILDCGEPDELALREFATLNHITARMVHLSKFWHPTIGGGQDSSVCIQHAEFADMVARISRKAADYEGEEAEECKRKVRAMLRQVLPDLPTWQVWEYQGRIKTEKIQDASGNHIPTGDFGDHTAYGTYVCLYIYTDNQGYYLYCLYNDQSEEWDTVIHYVAPHPEVLSHCHKLGEEML